MIGLSFVQSWQELNAFIGQDTHKADNSEFDVGLNVTWKENSH